MTVINKIYLQMLVQLLQRENLIYSYIWLFRTAWSAVNHNRTVLAGGEGGFGQPASTS